MNSKSVDVQHYRYERKFIVCDPIQAEWLLKIHPAMFSETFSPRFVNNIYFDSFNMTNYFDSIDGSIDRMKIRIRWYGDLFGEVESPVLELKIKRGLLSRKELFAMKGFSITRDSGLEDILGVMKEPNIKDGLGIDLLSFEVVLLSRYRRKYFSSADGVFRITVDSQMEYYSLDKNRNYFLCNAVDSTRGVVELKYDSDGEDCVEKVTNHFPWRITKSSKYLRGIERLNMW